MILYDYDTQLLPAKDFIKKSHKLYKQAQITQLPVFICYSNKSELETLTKITAIGYNGFLKSPIMPDKLI